MIEQSAIRRIVLLVLVVAIVIGVAMIFPEPGEALKEETKGYYLGQQNNEITIALHEGRGQKSFRISGATRVFYPGMKMTLSTIPPRSRVIVTSEDGIALDVFVKEVPK